MVECSSQQPPLTEVGLLGREEWGRREKVGKNVGKNVGKEERERLRGEVEWRRRRGKGEEVGRRREGE